MSLASAPLAYAQSRAVGTASASGGQSASNSGIETVVVTGTLIQGIAPVGTNVLSLSTADIKAVGATSTNDLLATIPQENNFNSVPVGTSTFGQPIASTNLRSLGASGGTTTLVLLNGHRLVGSGILQTYVDPTIIPPGMIDHVEVMPDGGSSIYGSDAIGGVINIITKKSMSGVDVNGKGSFANGWAGFAGNATAGTDWGSGSALLSYSYIWHSHLQGNETDYVTQNLTSHGGGDFRTTTCPLPDITIGGTTYALPGLTPGSKNLCNTTDKADIYPKELRHSIFADVNQSITSDLSADVTAYYSSRVTHTATAPQTVSGTITKANPFFMPIGAETSQTVSLDLSAVQPLGYTDSPARFDSWGITPSFEYDISSDWSLRGLLNYGHSVNKTVDVENNTTYAANALVATTTATALDPYNVTKTNAAVLNGILDYQNLSQANQNLAEGRLVADGTVFSISGGDVRLAVGAEYHYDDIGAHIAFGNPSAPKTNSASASRRIFSLYGELNVPIVSASNAMPGLQELSLDVSGRYDHYSDVGDATNPKIGFNYKPVSWITFRGNWGTSFHAPSLADTTGAVDARITEISVSPFRAATSPFVPDFFRPTLYISGGNADLKPETADTWSLGFDAAPDFIPGLDISATYYNIHYKNEISVNAGAFLEGPSFYTNPVNDPFYILNPTVQQTATFDGGVRTDNFDSLQQLYATAGTPYVVLDLRRYNLGGIKQDGIDFSANWIKETSFGSISAGLSGTYTLHRLVSSIQNAPFVEVLDNNNSRFRFVANVGAEAGPVTSRLTLEHSGGYPIQGDPKQLSVAAYDVVNLYIGLDLEKIGLLNDTVFSVNVDNLMDQDPPWHDASGGYANGLSLGRVIEIGIDRKF